ncbi:protein of unknown function [Peptoclostridium litorale DSM 5388]|uniref:DUF1836 domain-containing protein n=1 Tax=Peptoclostridium litorale DSM 5388 TaxID=1121324 RepID=A0A069REZ7_PEPLI|nr:DUF1836 domain-containing protein [Peptoclostridium litorale]KDR95586.1 hypothetical protein CLIT_10c03130 [Peptoclostridium litorale DSM 5388]SIN98849.1 protein of unknown function [Peptoclostridium litorale DSM 5388]
MKTDEINKVVDEMSLSENIELADIPDIELYMEQVTGFIDDRLKNLKRDSSEKTLTKTMINNYTKLGILMPPKNKKYSKDHMILMLLVYYLKQVLSLDDIKALIAPILNDMSTTEDDVIPLEDIYSIFLELKSLEFEDFKQDIEEKYNVIRAKTNEVSQEEADIKEKAELFLTVIMLIAKAHANKRLAEKIIDKFFK